MALSKETLEATEFAKSQIMNSDLDENVKKQLHNLLNVSMMATNGLSVEEKIQKITECISNLAILQFTFLQTVDARIAKANKEQCKSCSAMKHADEVKFEKQRQEIIEQWKKANGIIDGNQTQTKNPEDNDDSLIGFFKRLLMKPYAWIFGSLVVISPYGVDIVNAILQIWK